MRVLIDCDTWAVRELACGDCVMTVLLRSDPGVVELDGAEQTALDALAGGGLLPPLRLVPTRRTPPAAGPRTAIA